MRKIITSVAIAVFIIGVAVVLGNGGGNTKGNNLQDVNNVSVVDGKQVITINAKGGYMPRATTAKADMPTVLRLTTNGTFDCSSALVIPSLSYRANLPASGETLIDVPPQKAGTTMRGLCAMGMYNFSVNFN